METGIIGFPKSGKTTVFNALTKGKAEIGSYSSGALIPNIGMVKVPDQRIDILSGIFKPKKTTHAEIKYVDIALPPKTRPKEEGLDDHIVAYLSNVDSIIHVVRAFIDDNIPHIEQSIDPERDIASMEMELAFSDLALIEKRIERLKVTQKSAKQSERDAGLNETIILENIKASLEQGIPIREQSLSEEVCKIIENYQFLTVKPLLVLINIGEEDIPNFSELEASYHNRYKQHPNSEITLLCAKPEMELAQLENSDAQDFRLAMGLPESALDRIIQYSYSLLGLISFFTTGTDEVKAWTIRKNTTALKAAAKIHTDLAKGFIRAEVISYEALVDCGTMVEARKHGLIRLEGKTYMVQDGDCITILFNI